MPSIGPSHPWGYPQYSHFTQPFRSFSLSEKNAPEPLRHFGGQKVILSTPQNIVLTKGYTHYMLWCMEFATILLIVCSICVGVVSAIVATWRLRVDLYSLRDRLSVVEGIQTREVKIRAGESRGKRVNADEALVLAGIERQAQPQPGRVRNWWETDHVKSIPASWDSSTK
jgi:hypothetical protein